MMENDQIYFEHIIKVYCTKCKDWIDEKLVEFVNIEEGMFGEDRLTFVCPHCKKQSTSVRM